MGAISDCLYDDGYEIMIEEEQKVFVENSEKSIIEIWIPIENQIG